MLYLVRHAAVTVRPDLPGPLWHLSPEGRVGANALAREPFWASVRGIHTSAEPKAVATAQRLASVNELPIRIEPDLREVEGRAWVEGGYSDQVHAYLAGDAPEGWEPIEDARARVTTSIHGIVARHEGLNVGIVSHGIVLTIYLSGALGLTSKDAIALWDRIKFPDAAAFDPQTKHFKREFGS